jgi:hypothetical protein
VQEIARTVLAQHGLGDIEPRVTEAVAVDLDGDGTVERVISATTAREAYTENAERGDYSFVAVESGGRIDVLNGAFFPYEPTTHPLPNLYSIGGILDVDGDGRMEVIVHYIGYEWSGDEAYRITPGRITNLFGAYTGGV